WELPCLRVPPQTLESSSPTKSRSGARWSGLPASRRNTEVSWHSAFGGAPVHHAAGGAGRDRRDRKPEPKMKLIDCRTRLLMQSATPREATMLQIFLKALFAFVALGVVTGGAASAEECSGSITAEEVLRAEDARYAAQIANDFAAMEQMFG